MHFAERVKQLDIPPDKLVIIGSGVLDVLGLRQANDIDAVVPAELFADLCAREDWTIAAKHRELVAQKADAEVFLSWGSDGRPNFEELYDGGIEREGMRFAHPQTVIEWKRLRDLPKDRRDIELLQMHLDTLPAAIDL